MLIKEEHLKEDTEVSPKVVMAAVPKVVMVAVPNRRAINTLYSLEIFPLKQMKIPLRNTLKTVEKSPQLELPLIVIPVK